MINIDTSIKVSDLKNQLLGLGDGMVVAIIGGKLAIVSLGGALGERGEALRLPPVLTIVRVAQND